MLFPTLPSPQTQSLILCSTILVKASWRHVINISATQTTSIDRAANRLARVKICAPSDWLFPAFSLHRNGRLAFGRFPVTAIPGSAFHDLSCLPGRTAMYHRHRRYCVTSWHLYAKQQWHTARQMAVDNRYRPNSKMFFGFFVSSKYCWGKLLFLFSAKNN